MKKQFLLLIVFLFAFCMQHLLAQTLAAKIDSGSINEADYKIVFPASWKGKLVMYAHGYEVKGLVPKHSKSPGFLNSMTPYLERGFAVAASDYSIQGFAVVQGVNETEVLRKYFVKKYGRPDKTFMVGGSMGGVLQLPQSRTLVKTTMEVTNGQGHCAFTPQQIGQVFDELRAWANTGKKPEPGAIE